MSWLDPKFKYHDAEESRKPGYLARRFAAWRKEKRAQEEAQAAAEAEAKAKVAPIGAKKAAR